MSDNPSPVTVVATLPATVTTTVIRRRRWAILALNIASGAGQTLLLVLAYLQTINLANVVTPGQALAYGIGVNVATIVLRQFFSPPAITQTTIQQGQP